MLEENEDIGKTGMFAIATDYRYTTPRGKKREVHHIYGPFPDRETAVKVAAKARRDVARGVHEDAAPGSTFTTHVCEVMNEAAMNKVPQEYGHNLYRMHADNAATLNYWVGQIMVCDHGHHFSVEKGENNLITSMLGLHCATGKDWREEARRG